MIKLQRSPEPKELNSKLKKLLIKEFKSSGKSVWNKRTIKKALLDSSNNKCAFTECKLGEEGKYMEVEHYFPKSIYPDKVVDWDNLIPVNKKVNVSKGETDPTVKDLLNPYDDDPKDHLTFSAYRFKAKTNKGQNTIDIYALNDTKNFVNPRFIIGNSLQERLESILTSINGKDIYKIRNEFRGLLNEAIPEAEYSALCATIILNSTEYSKIKTELIGQQLWDQGFNEVEKKMLSISLLP